jgi:hypothetical protein
MIMARDDNKCVVCKSDRVVQWSHFPSRSYHATRWLSEGAVAHCSQCHIRFTYAPLEHEQAMVEFWGEPMLRAIKRRALDGAAGRIDIDLSDVWDYLQGVADTKYGSPILPLDEPLTA